MAVEQHLPEPPPARPARRDAAIDAALRRFDGLLDAPPVARERRRSWASTHRPQLAVAVSAMLILVVGIPAALIGLREKPTAPQGNPPVAAQERFEPAPPPAPRAPEAAEVAQAPPSNVQLGAAPPPRKDQGEEAKLVANNEPQSAAQAPAAKAATPAAPPAPAPQLAEAAPPPPPPPPPAAERDEIASAEKVADRDAGQDIVISGTRMRQPAASTERYRPFLARLQSAMRANDRRAVLRLIAFPLRVNGPAGPKFYRSTRSVERDFDLIFTPKVRQAVLEQRADRLFVRDQGAMVGEGELWFDEICIDADCSSPGPVRIKAVNP